MAHDVTEAKARLENLQKREAKRKHRSAANERGFDVLADFEAWQVLEDLRNATLKARRETEEAGRKKEAPNPTYYYAGPSYYAGGLVSPSGRITSGITFS